MVEIHQKHSRILVLTSTFPRWKNDTEPAFVYELSRRLSRRLGASFDISILAPRTPGSIPFENMDGLRVIRFPYFFKRMENLATHSGGILNKLMTNPFNYLLVPFFMIGQLAALINLLTKEKFDLIHAHWIIPQGLTAVIGLILTHRRLPLLCTSHGGDLFALRGKILQCIKRWILGRSKCLTVVSMAMQNIVVGMGVAPEKVRVVSMGVDLRHKFVPDSRIRRNHAELLFVGRLVEKKGLRILLQAMPKVLVSHPSVRLNIVGAGPLAKELRKLTKQLNISDHVDFLGMVSQHQLPDFYRRATLSIFPFIVAKSGDQDGLGLVQVEAMGCGCPVIASDLPVIRDIITHEVNGILVPPCNTESLAQAVINLLAAPDVGHRLAQAARKKVLEQFDWEIIVQKYANIYQEHL